MAELFTIEQMRLAARRKLPKQIFDFIDGGAGDEITLRANRTAFERVVLRPRQLVDVSTRTLSRRVLGETLPLPIVFAPTGLQRLVHRNGELETARAAGDAALPFTVSTGSSFSIEEIAAVSSGSLWFQLYLWRDRDVVSSLVNRAKAAGYRVLVVAVDVPLVGLRDRDLRNGMTIPPRIRPKNVLDAARHPRWVRELITGPPITFRNFVNSGLPVGDSGLKLMAYVNKNLINPRATWEELLWLRALWPGKLIVKGVLTAEDSVRAVEAGADGVVVSNHGGRQLDCVPATLDVLPEVVAAVGDRAEVLVDGGIRRGTDIVKALALGARAVMIGRPYWWGLTLAGGVGVSRVIEIFRDELDMALALIGRPDVSELDASAVSRGTTLGPTLSP
jgi:isopentenyl diphosphate isomerase/L-lactate dehydrogenase-like FMN-dependent dehydrogenase